MQKSTIIYVISYDEPENVHRLHEAHAPKAPVVGTMKKTTRYRPGVLALRPADDCLGWPMLGGLGSPGLRPRVLA